MDKQTQDLLNTIYGLPTVQLNLLLPAVMEIRDEMKYRTWLDEVNRIVGRHAPLSLEDMKVRSYRTWHMTGLTAFHAAKRVLKEEGFNG